MATIVYIGAYEPKDDNEIPDDTNPAWRIHQGATDYLVADTTDGEESVDLVSSGTGTVGIGSGFTTPHELLHIANSGTEVGDDAYIKFTTEAGGHGAGDGAHIGLNKTGTFQIAMDDANDILLMQGAAPRLTVNGSGTTTLSPAAGNDALIVSSGDVGIGTTEPTSPLHVKVTDDSSKWLGRFEADGTTQNALKVVVDGTAGTGVSFEQGGNYTVFKNNGDVGIGTSSPSAQFHLQKDAGDAKILMENKGDLSADTIMGRIDFGNRDYDDTICSIVAAQESAFTSTADADGYLAFSTEAGGGGLTERMRLDADGKATIYERAELRSSLSVANTFTQGTMGIGLGVGAYAEGDSTVAVGYSAHAYGSHAVAVGQYCDALGANSLALGYDAVANDAHSIAIGFNNTCINPYSTSLGGAEWNSVKGAIRSELTIGLMETTDGTTTKLSTVSKKASGETSVDLTVYTSGTSTVVAGINKDYVMDLRISITSVCTGAGGSFTVGEFVTREYVLSGVYIHSGTSFKVYEGSTEYTSDADANALRSSVRSNDSATIGHASNGIIDRFTLTESGGRGGIQISVDSQDTTAKVFHSARVWADATLANYVA